MKQRTANISLALYAIVVVLLIAIFQRFIADWYQDLPPANQLYIMIAAGIGVLFGLTLGGLDCYTSSRFGMAIGGVACAMILWLMGVLSGISFTLSFLLSYYLVFFPVSWISRHIPRDDEKKKKVIIL